MSDPCRIERALLPERVFSMSWSACPGLVGCRQLVDPGGAVIGATYDGGRGYAIVLTGLPPYRVLAIVPTDAPAIAAWRTPDVDALARVSCVVSEIALGEGQAAFATQFIDFDNVARSEHRIYAAALEEIGAAETPLIVLPSAPWVAGGRTIDSLHVSRDLIVWQMDPDGNVYAHRAGETRTLHDGTGGLAQNLALVGGQVLWESWGDAIRLEHAAWDSTRTYFRSVAPGDARGFGTDGVDVAWLEGFDRAPDGRYARTDLWTAAYSGDLAIDAPRLVRSFSGYGNAAAGGGWYVLARASPERVDVYSLADGARRAFTPPAGGRIAGDPFYVRATEMFVPGNFLVDPRTLPIVETPDAGVR